MQELFGDEIERLCVVNPVTGEIEELSLVVLAFVDRNRQVKADRTHRRVPNQTCPHRGADYVGSIANGVLRIADGLEPGDMVITLGAGSVSSASEMILEGLHSIDKISRSEERGFAATERKGTQELYRDYTIERNRHKKPLN